MVCPHPMNLLKVVGGAEEWENRLDVRIWDIGNPEVLLTFGAFKLLIELSL